MGSINNYNSTITNQTLYNFGKTDDKTAKLLIEINQLHAELKKRSEKTPEHYAAIAAIDDAATALKQADTKSFNAALKIAGKWAASIAGDIGANLVSQAINSLLSQ